jgi:hypothetical protein
MSFLPSAGIPFDRGADVMETQNSVRITGEGFPGEVVGHWITAEISASVILDPQFDAFNHISAGVAECKFVFALPIAARPTPRSRENKKRTPKGLRLRRATMRF